MKKQLLTIFFIANIMPNFALSQNSTLVSGSAPNVYNGYSPGYMNGGIDPVTAIRNSQNQSVQQSQQDNSNITQSNTQNPDSNIVPGWKIFEDNDNKQNTSQQEDKTQENTLKENHNQITETNVEEIDRVGRILSGKSEDTGNPNIKNITESKNKKTTSSIPKVLHISGIPTVLDGITLELNGHEFSLYNMEAPGNKQICYKEGMPWSCGEDATRSLKNIVSNNIISCNIIDNSGECVTDTGSDLIHEVLLSGFVIPNKKDGISHKNEVLEAKYYHRGLYQK